ncbi:hypothetical protein AGMMS50267_12110 [Spirochaetia bacterium]|nr:hypothetical protein AGMMS50267_12110 [Spirochaetia bacterium]
MGEVHAVDADDEGEGEIKATDGLNNIAGPSTRGFLTHPSKLTILRNIIFVNSAGAAKVIDENGEPKEIL